MLKLRHLFLSDIFWLIVFGLTILYSLGYKEFYKPQSRYSLNTHTIIGTIKKYQIDGNLLKILIASKEDITANYYIKTLKEKQYLISHLKYGQEIRVNGELTVPKKNTIPHTFNYQKYLKYQRIYFIMKIDQYKLVNKPKLLYRFKNYIVNQIEKHPNTKGYLYTFILGDKKALAEELFSQLQNNGVIHLFDVSGMHITLFATVLLFLLKKLPPKLKYLVINGFIFTYG